MDFDDRPVHKGTIALGAVVMSLGLVFLLDGMNLFEGSALAVYWPGLLVAFGMTRIIWPSRPGGEVGGLWIALVGGLLLLDKVDVMPLRESWPVFVIMAGLLVMFRALDWLPTHRQRGPQSFFPRGTQR